MNYAIKIADFTNHDFTNRAYIKITQFFSGFIYKPGIVDSVMNVLYLI